MTTPTTPTAERDLTPLGPGTLNFGAAGALIDISGQTTACSIEWDSEAADSEYVLSGDTIGGDTSFTATLTFTAFQDIEKSGLIDVSWNHKGETVDFVFKPQNGQAATVKGKVTIMPVNLGGDVRSRNKSEASWPIVGEPVFTPDSTAGNIQAWPSTGSDG